MDLVFSCMCCKLVTIESEHKNANLVYDHEISCILMRCQNACTHVQAATLILVPFFREKSAAYPRVNTVSLVICIPPPGKHIPSDMCSPTWETNIPCDMCFLLIKPIYLVICVPLPGKHISLVICVPLPQKHKFLVICVPQPRKHIEVSLVICFFPPRKHISLVILVL